MIPLPFSFAIACAAIAVFTSKLQYPPTHLLLALHSISSPLCLAAIYFILLETLANPTDLLIWISAGLFGTLNLLGTIAQTCIFTGDANLIRWTRAGSQKPKYSIYAFWFIFVTLIAALGGFQFQNIIFCRLFNFSCFKAQLKSIQIFRVCHLLNFLAYAPQIIIVYTVATALQNVSVYSLKMVLIDCLVVTIINMSLAILVSRKEDNFFSEIENGLHINKVTCLNEDDNTLVYMQESQNKIKSLPDILEFDEFGYCTTKRNRSIKKSMKKVSQQSNANIGSEQEGDLQEESRKDKTQSVEQKTQTEIELKQNQLQQQPQNIDNIFKQGANIGAYDVGQVDRYSQQDSKMVGKVQTVDVASQTIREVKAPNIMIIEGEYIEESEIISDKQDQIFQNHSIVKEEPLVFSGLEVKPQINLHQSNPKNELEELDIQHQKQVISEEFNSEHSSDFQQLKKQVGYTLSKTAINKPFELFINRQALIESQSSFTNTETIRRQLQNQQLFNQEQAKAKALFKKTASKHRSPPKTIIKDDRQQQIFHIRNHNFAKMSQPNAQMPIKQKNLRGKIGPNHPMNGQQSSYPLRRVKKTEEYSCINDDESNRQAKRQKLKAPKSTIDHHNYAQSSQISLEQQHKKYNTFNLQPEIVQAQTSDYKKFTRSNFKSMAGLFTRLRKNDVCQSEIMTIDKPPQQPSRNSISSITPTQHLANLFRRNGVRSAPRGRPRPQTSKEKQIGRRFNQQKKLGVGLESKKMNSLEKIYLQRLNNF